MNKLPIERRCQIITALCEGNSLCSTSRMVGVSINTVTKLLVDVGTACARYHHENVRGLTTKRVQVDELWCFVYAKEKNVPAEHKGELGYGDVWTWVAIDADTKIVPSYLVGWRDVEYATTFMKDLASRLTNRVQLNSDGHKPYLEAVEEGFGGEIDFAQLIELYGPAGATENPETHYSPGECCGTKRKIVCGYPDKQFISTSFAERQNLTVRTRMRRFTRLTNGFSKKFENLEHAIALHYMHYNFVKRHQTLRMPPALKAGVTDHVLEIEEIVRLADSN